MKGFSTLLILFAVLALAGCGKENESGKSGSGTGICLQYGVNGACSQYSAYTTGLQSGSININSIVAQIPCEFGGSRIQVTGTAYTSSFTTPGQAYLGVTSMGDIAIIQGAGSKTSQMVVFLCQSGVAQPAAGTFQVNATLGEFSSCAGLKTITSATLSQTLRFRDPVYGRGTTGQPFSFCASGY